ncbi:MAG: SLBB domain-containing protein [Bacteroidetes bacterium]|uniref:SLBB domain-containing protein n=1 Tax=Phnomibacter sp. TaxID=2836217 RepID=UPI002FDD8FDA|nr:SLBB domain-containing protein [Bacteroidota bacterium]
MKLTGFFLLLTWQLLIAANGIAQTLNAENLRNIEVSAIADEEIKTFYNKAISSGLTEEQLYTLAVQRGMPEVQIAKLRARISELNLGKTTSTKPPASIGSNTERQIMPGMARAAMQQLKRDSSIFGAELFSEASNVFEPNYKIATPTGYTLGPGDELLIQVFGYSEQAYSLKVNAEGAIYIANVGPIQVAGLSVDDAGAKIKSRMAATIYKAIKSGQTKVSVTLGSIRSIQVAVMGQASKPGNYTVSSLTTLFNLLYLCGGPSNEGSFRQIELIRGDKVYRKVDLYSYLLRGDRKDNVLLQDQDIVRIPYYSSRVVMEGEVRRAGKFELLPNENIDQLFTYSGGFSDSAYRSAIKVIRITDTGRILADVPATDFASFTPKSGDAFIVAKALAKYNNRVSIRGAVYRPGDYELKPGMQLSELMAKAGGIKPDAFMGRGIIARLKEDQTAASVSFHVGNVAAGKELVALVKEDIVTISSIFDLKDAQTVEVQGMVRLPGKFQFRESLTIKDALLLSGGFADGADPASIEISRRMAMVDVSSDEYRQAEVIKIDLKAGLDKGGDNVVLQPFDVISVRAKGGYEKQRAVYVMGQIITPGIYPLESSKETISQIINRAGGFRGSADSSSISIRRLANYSLGNEEREKTVERLLMVNRDSLLADPELRRKYLNDIDFLSVNVEKIKSNPGGPEDLILENGDVIEIARASNLVRVSGEVYRPGLLPFEEGASAHYYVKRSGNFTSNSRKTKTFVIYPDGRAKSVKRFLFIKTYPEVTPRSEVFIPSKDKDGKKGLSTGEWIALSSIGATLATLVVTVINAFK